MGIISTLGPYLLPFLLPAIERRLPRLKLVIQEGLTADLMTRLSAHGLDGVILALPVLETLRHLVAAGFDYTLLPALALNEDYAGEPLSKRFGLSRPRPGGRLVSSGGAGFRGQQRWSSWRSSCRSRVWRG